jgi:hypothetical protein
MEQNYIMTDIVIKAGMQYDDPDAPKDCKDFVPLNDGTSLGDKKYCDLSRFCKQVGMFGEWIEYYEVYTDNQGNVVKEKVRDYLCTGKQPIWEERSRDGEAS